MTIVTVRRVIHTAFRLADNSTVPIVLRPTQGGWLRLVLNEGDKIRHCRRVTIGIADVLEILLALGTAAKVGNGRRFDALPQG